MPRLQILDYTKETNALAYSTDTSIKNKKSFKTFSSGLFLPDHLEGTDVGPIIEALYSQLENRNREQVKRGHLDNRKCFSIGITIDFNLAIR
jgi:hypothetical protein